MSRTKHILSYAIPIVILLFFLFGSFFAPHDPTATNIRDKYLPSSAEYPFGTDDFGRCEFSRILEGGKTTLDIRLLKLQRTIFCGLGGHSKKYPLSYFNGQFRAKTWYLLRKNFSLTLQRTFYSQISG